MRVLILLVLTLITPSDRCPEVPLEGVSTYGCKIRQESHGWKLLLEVRYTKGGTWEKTEKPTDREFWPSDAAAFERCSEWRACLTKKLLAHAEERRRNRQ